MLIEIVVLASVLAIPGFSGGPVISEFMASNKETIEDQDGDSSDWIEIYNNSAAALDLGGWFLTDDDKNLFKWSFPAPTLLEPGGFLLVFASEKDRRLPGAELHTNFKLKVEGEYLALVSPSRTIAHEYRPQFPPQYEDLSYGLSFQGGALTSSEAFFVLTTPGSANGEGGPAVFHRSHQPNVPTLNDPVVVTALAAPPRGRTLFAVVLRYRVMYNTSVRVDMFDDGTGGDATAGDGIFTGVIPAGAAQPGEMLRWLVRAKDSQGFENAVPPYADPVDSPQYFGTMVEDPSVVSALPVYHWFIIDPSYANRPAGGRASLFFGGRFYDNIWVHPRGGSTQGMTKNPYKFNFNSHDKFEWDPNAPKIDEVNINSTWSDKAYIRQNLAFETYELAEVHGSRSFPIRLEQNGEFFSVAIFVEENEEELLERLSMDPDGALYKMYNPCSGTGSTEKKTRQWEDKSDLADLVAGIQQSGAALDQYLFDNLDLPKTISYVAATNLIHDNDHVAKNYYLYRDSDGDLEWEPLPWDKDLTFGRHWDSSKGLYSDDMWADDDPMSHPLYGDYNYLIAALFRSERTRVMFLRRFRSLMDEYLQRKSVPYDERHFESRCEELYNLMLPDVNLDAARWGVPSWGTPMDFREALDQLILSHLRPRRTHLFQTHVQMGTLPEEQGHMHLCIGAVEADPSSANPAEEYVEITNPNDLAVDVSGWTLSGGAAMRLCGGSVIAPHDSAYLSPDVRAFRSRAASPTGGEGRLVLGPWTGTLENGEPIFLSDRDGTLIASTRGLELTANSWVAGQEARLLVIGAAPGDSIAFLFSYYGPGPTDTPLGPLALTYPFYLLAVLPADAAGAAEVDFIVPAQAAGIPLWIDAIDLETRTITNGLALVIQ